MNLPKFRPVVKDHRQVWQSSLPQTGPVPNLRPPSYRSRQSRMVDPYHRARERPVDSQAVYTVGTVMTERVRGHQHSRGPFPAGVQ